MKNLIEYLTSLGTGEIKPKSTEYGICHSINYEFCNSDAYNYLEKISKLWVYWPKYSGSKLYPVGIDSKKYYPDYLFVNVENLWGDDEYGNNRRELCLWLAEQLEKGLKYG